MTTFTLILSLALQFGESQHDQEESGLRSALTRAESEQPVNPQAIDQALVDLAGFLSQHGRYREAEPLYVRSSDITRSTHGPTSAAAALSLLRLGAIYHAQLRFEQAETLTRRAADLLQQLAGPDSVAYAYAMANLATILAEQGENARAEPVLRRALFLIQKHHDRVMPTLEANLGLIYLRQGEPQKAAPLLQSAYDAFESAQNPARASALAALAELAVVQHRWLDADAQIRQACKLTIEMFGEDHPWLVGMLHLRAQVKAHAGDPRSAASDMKRSVELMESLPGHDAPTLARLLEEYAAVLRQAKKRNEAKLVLRQAKALRQ